MRFRNLFVLSVPLCLATVTPVCAQGPLNPPVPLVQPVPLEVLSPGTAAVSLAAAQRAQELGMTTVAAELYRQLLAVPGADRTGLTLTLVTVLLDGGEAAEAEKALATLAEPHGVAWRLRAGLADLQLKKRDAAQAEWDAIKQEQVAPADLPWYYYLTATLYDTAARRDDKNAVDFYNRAKAAAATDMARARFQLAAERLRLLLGQQGDLEGTLKSYEKNAGTLIGYGAARLYAVMLNARGRTSDAVTFLRDVLLTLPPAERLWRDEFRFLLGLIGDRTGSGMGRRALYQLLDNGSDTERQRQGVQLLADASKGGVERDGWRDELDKLLAVPRHPIRENLLLYRAQLALAEKKYGEAADRANELLQQFPGSPLRVHAYAVLTGSAWEQQRYHGAADNARKARDELAASAAGTDATRAATRAALGVLEAEAWFRAGLASGDANDFRNAADAYAAAWREQPSGELMLQRVLADIQAGALDMAQALLDDPTTGFGTEYRWQAEWTLARSLQVQKRTAEALARVTKMLASAPPSAAAGFAELRVRMKWLQARLSFEAGHPEQTLELADKLAEEASALEPTLRDDILSTGALLKAEADFALGRDAAREILKKLRDDFPKSHAAISSYQVEAYYYANLNKIADAQRLLKELADKFPTSEYAPYALYRAALLAESLGQTDKYEEANLLLVELVKKYPQSELVFDAQMREGAVKMKLNRYADAQAVFLELVTKFPQRKDVTLALLELARCINAQSAGNPAMLEKARTKFGDLRDRVDAPVEVRVEAGYYLGDVLMRRGNPEDALVVWWRDVVQAFLPEGKDAAELGSTGSYWMARALIQSGEEDWKLGKLEDAKVAWQYVLRKQLPFAVVARAKLAAVGMPEVTP